MNSNLNGKLSTDMSNNIPGRIQISFLRHGFAEDHASSGLDRDRELTQIGIDIVKRQGEYMVQQKFRYDFIITSPYPRAQKTAEIVAEALSLSGVLKVDARIACGFHFSQLLELIIEANGCNSILFVGHNPDLSLLTGQLSGAHVNLKKGGLAILDVWKLEPGGADLLSLLTPALMGAK
ncbi:MAG: histidine phosphatase family protein [Chthonomonadales bacterium]